MCIRDSTQEVPIKKKIKKALQRQAKIQRFIDNKNMQVITISNKTINETTKITNIDTEKKKSKQRKTKLPEKIKIFEVPNKIYSNETRNVINLVKGTQSIYFAFYYSFYMYLTEKYLQDNTTFRFSSLIYSCLLYTSPSPRDATLSRMPSSA